MNYHLEEYRSRVLGCFLGKNVGGTLGMKDEWHRRINHVDYYVHEINGEPLPNDDMDIQLIWLIALEEQGVHINSRTLGDYWMYYVTPHWAEYGNCKTNMRMGIQPPFSGKINNPYTDSCGAYIRSEIWACLAPGCPKIAVSYAYQDALIDHGEGEGLYAEIFCAAMESAAFIEHDIHNLLEIGLSYIPADCAIAKAVRLVQELYEQNTPWTKTRDMILQNYLGGFIFSISEEDMNKGFYGGRVGWEAPSNIALITLALLYGEGDFGNTICLAVNCGEDTDCTAATAGALMGIIKGIDHIDSKWASPIGTKLKPACLNLGELGNLGSLLPKDIYELENRIECLAHIISSTFSSPVKLSDLPTTAGFKNLFCDNLEELYIGSNSTRFAFDFFDIDVTYENGIQFEVDKPKKVTFTIHNQYKIPENIYIRIYAPEITILPDSQNILYVPHDVWVGRKSSITFLFSPEVNRTPNYRAVAEFTCPSHSGVMLVPLYFLSCHSINITN